MNNLWSIFSGKRILITGDTGFKGAWLSYWLNMLGANIVGYALPPEPHQRLFNDLNLSKLIHHLDGDIRHLPQMSQVFAEFKPEIVFHLAAQPLVRRSYTDPKETFEVNVQGSVNVLECVRSSESVQALVYVTSDKCYENNEWIWGYRETDRLGGPDPYSASKAAAEIIFSSYCRSFFKQREGLGVASARAGNVIGGGDWSIDRIVPDAIRALQRHEPIKLRNPSAVRPWQHVLDPLGGYLLLAARLLQDPKRYTGSWNFGPSTESIANVEELIKQVISAWGEGHSQHALQHGAVHEAGLLTLNCDKAYHLLHWKPTWDFQNSVQETVLWYKKAFEGGALGQLTQDQINRYMRTCGLTL